MTELNTNQIPKTLTIRDICTLKEEDFICKEHLEINDYILMEDAPQHNVSKYSSICKNCLSDINREREDDLLTKLFDRIIINNQEKIIQIKENKYNFVEFKFIVV